MSLRKLQRSGLSFGAALGLLGWCLVLMGAAGSPRTAPIAVINSTRITAESTTIQDFIAEVSVEAQATRDELDRIQGEMKTAIALYSAQESVTNEEGNLDRKRRIEAMTETIEELKFRLGRQLKKAQEEMIGPTQKRIQDAIGAVATERGIQIVLTAEQTIFFDSSIDLTDAVVARLDRQ